MPTETGTIDLKAQKAGHDDAAKTATNYITEISGEGISVSGNNSTSSVEIASTVKVKKSAASYSEQTADGLNVYADESGSAVLVGSFGADGVRLGQAVGLHTHVDKDSFDLFADAQESSSIFHVGYPTGATVTDTFVGDGTTTGYMLSNTPSGTVSVTIDGTATSAFSVSGTTLTMTTAPASGAVIAASYPTAAYIPYYTLGTRSGNADAWSVAEGHETEASAYSAHAEGSSSRALGDASHAEGENTAAYGVASHAEGYQTTASGWLSHAEGSGTTASGSDSHAEGGNTAAVGFCAHAEGENTSATNRAAHAEGRRTTARGSCSHAQNIGTVSARSAQTVIGTYNSEDTATTITHPNGNSDYGEYALVIGNGTGDDNRSNAFAVKWDGATVHATDMSTTVVGDVISPASGITIDSVRCETWGRLASLYICVKPSAAKSGSWDVGTLVPGLRPPFEHGAWTGNESHNAWLYPTGVVRFYGTVAAGASAYVKATYLLA